MQRSYFTMLVANRFGTLTKVTALFARRGCNIDSLTVSKTLDPDFSRITATVIGEPDKAKQVDMQLEKLYDVREHVLLQEGDDFAERALAMFLLERDDGLDELLQGWDLFVQRERLLDGTILMNCSGPMEQVEALGEKLAPFGVVDMVCSGPSALQFNREV